MKIVLHVSLLVLAIASVVVNGKCEKNFYTVSNVHNLIQKKGWSCVDVIEHFLRRGAKYNKKLNAIINFNSNAIAEALKIDEYYKKNKQLIGKLHCVPIIVKDNLDVAGIPSTGAIKALRYSIPNKDSIVVRRLKAEGGIIIAKANMAELGDAPQYNTEMRGMCLNPWDQRRSCGISSAGSGASGAAGLCVIAIGTDTEGSIIEPATFNGLFGLRPPYDFSMLEGMVPGLQKIDAIGPMSKSLDDTVLAYSIIANNTELLAEYQQTKKIHKLFEPELRIGVLKTFLAPFDVDALNLKYTVNSEVLSRVNKALKNLDKLEVGITEIELSESETQSFMGVLLRIILGKPSCGRACAKLSWDAYFGDKERFQSDAPYHSLEDFANSPFLSEEFQSKFKPATKVGDAEASCKTGCADFDAARVEFANIVRSWLVKNNVDALVFPSVADLPYILQPETKFANFQALSALFFSPYSGFGSINIPIGFSRSNKNAPDGTPIGLNLLAPKESLLKSFMIARRYEKAYVEGKRPILPSATPDF